MGFFTDLVKDMVLLPFDVASEALSPSETTRTTSTCVSCGVKGGTGFGHVAGQECSSCGGSGVVTDR